MSHIKDRLSSYHDWMQDIVNRYKLVTARDFLEMIKQLQNDLKQDEKENGWITVSERLPEIKQNYAECYLVTDGRFCWMAYWTPEKSGFLLIAQIAKIKLIGQTSWLGCHFQNHIRRTKHGKNNTMPRRGTRKL